MIAFDTNIYVYTLDADAPTKRLRAIELLSVQPGEVKERPLLWQVACEFIAFLRRQHEKGRISEADVDHEVESLISNHRILVPAPEAIKISLNLRKNYSLSHWDSLLLAACISAGINTLYSEDMSHGMTYESVTVINPFQTA